MLTKAHYVPLKTILESMGSNELQAKLLQQQLPVQH